LTSISSVPTLVNWHQDNCASPAISLAMKRSSLFM
jgi:hypothetical protein